MKKFIVIALAVVMMVSALAVFAACGTTYEGSCSYKSQWGDDTYGVAVIVTVTSDRHISKVVLKPDSETGWVRTSLGWGEGEGKNQNPGDLGHDDAEAAYQEWLEKVFYGKTVEEVLAYKATATTEAQFTGETADGARPAYNLTGATQSAARIILAVQDALKKVPAAE